MMWYSSFIYLYFINIISIRNNNNIRKKMERRLYGRKNNQ